MSKNNFLFLFNMNMLMRFIMSSVLTIALIYTATVYNFLEGISSIQLWWMIMLAGGIVLIITTLGTAWHWFGFVLASFLIGISSQLGLTQPLWFQYIKIVPEDSFSYILYAAIAVQAIIALSIHLSYGLFPAIYRLINTLSLIRSLSFILIILAFSVATMRYIGDHNLIGLLGQIVIMAAFLLINIASLFALSRILPENSLKKLAQHIEHCISLPNTKSHIRIYDRYFPYIVALWVLLISIIICVFAFERMGHVEDEIAYLFQAKYLLLGRLAVPPPVVPEAFSYFLLHLKDNLWFSACLPGWPAVLTLGVLFNSAWLVNPILAAITILLAHTFFSKISSRGYANIAILLMAVSPWFILMSASLMPHILTLTLTLAAWLSLLDAQKKDSMRSAFIGGIFMGGFFLTRPLDGMIIGLLTFLWTLSILKKGTSWKVIVGYCLGCIAMGSLIFPYNEFLTGSPLTTTINQYIDELWYPGANSLGFGEDIGPRDLWSGLDLYHGHSFREALVNSQQNIYTLNFDLFGWGIGSLSIFLAHLLWGKWTRNEFHMLAIIIVTISVFSLYWFSGSFYIGPRYWFISFLPLIAITTSGISTLIDKFRTIEHFTLPAQKFCCVFLCLCVISISTSLSWRSVSRYYEFGGFHTDYRSIQSENDLQNSLVFVKTTATPDFASAFMYNSPTFSGSAPIFARDLGSKSNRIIANAFPDRSIYFVEGRINKQRSARIVLGPVSRSTLP